MGQQSSSVAEQAVMFGDVSDSASGVFYYRVRGKKDSVIVCGNDRIDGFNPQTGEE